MTKYKISADSQIALNFSLSLSDGHIVDSNFDGAPLEMAMGDGNMLTGFEAVLMGLQSGDEKEHTVKAADAFGLPNKENIQCFPRRQFSQYDSDSAGENALVEGLVISFADKSGAELPGVVKSVDADTVTIDFNHPLSGRDVVFKVIIHEVLS